MQIKGILSFPTLVTPKQMKDAAGNPTGDAKYTCAILLPPNDPQIAIIAAEVNKASLDTFPSGFPQKGDKCFGAYDERYRGKDYYDPRFSGWYVFSCSAKAEDKPTVVGSNLMPIMDPAKIFGGAVVWVHAGISGYTKGTGGVGGWLNGVMVTDEEPPMGRLDNKPNAEQMFANLPDSHQQHLAAGQPQHVAANGAVVTPGAFIAPPIVAAPAAVIAPPAPAKPMLLMTPKAGVGATVEAYLNSGQGWTEELLIQQGMAVRSQF